jgi:hypothetical protein
MNAVDHLKKLIDIMQRCSPVWCDINGKLEVDDEEWDLALGEAEDWIEDNTP